MAIAPPIQNLGQLDIVGERHDGGVDLVIVVSGALDGSAETLELLERKILNYIAELSSDQFKRRFGQAPGRGHAICIVSEYPVDALALAVIARLEPQALQAGASLELRRSMGS